ncbi:MAG: hypothetical protein H6621_06550 [Halobacteriovoraceae bacterium]|nr:hypothetical protein [Halobacteriovoraceae bacterium]
MSVSLKHPSNGLIKKCPEGFSWTTFFFNMLVPLFRGQWSPAAIIFLTGGFAGLYYMFTLNKIYATELLEKGYRPADEVDYNKLAKMGIEFSDNNNSKNENVA